MKINKEKSKKIKRLVTLSLTATMLSLLSISSNAEDDDYDKEQKKYHQERNEFLMAVNNLSEELYDKEYNDYCNNEDLIIDDEIHKLADIYIEYGYIGDKKVVYVIDYHSPKQDLITKNTVEKDYKRNKIMLLKYSDVFYNYYHDTDENKKLEDYVNQFEGGINYNVPETYFYNPELSTDKEKAK